MNSVPSHRFASLSDYHQHAKTLISEPIWAYIHGGAEDEYTLRKNREAFRSWEVLSRPMVSGWQDAGIQTNLFGEVQSTPFVVAPMAWHRLVHAEGEQATLQACAAQEVPLVVSSQSSVTIEDLMPLSQSKHRWAQLYLQPERQASLRLLRRFEQAGASVIVCTIDAPINGLRNQEQRHGFVLPKGIQTPHLDDLPKRVSPTQTHNGVLNYWMQHAPDWEDIKWLRSQTKLPLVLKGVMSIDAAKQCVAAGADGIVVSNHGGRVLDGQPASLQVLPQITEALHGACTVLFDSGIRRGSDAFKALALGADAVMVGRPMLDALAVNGAMGVAHALRLLRDELEATMALCGCKQVSEVGPANIQPSMW